MGKSVASKRRVVTYPSPVYHKLLIAESEFNETSKSNIVAEAIKQYYERMDEGNKRRLLSLIR